MKRMKSEKEFLKGYIRTLEREIDRLEQSKQSTIDCLNEKIKVNQDFRDTLLIRLGGLEGDEEE